MTEAEKQSFFNYSATRGPGKRQIKPTAAMADLVLPADDEEDDEDFIGGDVDGSGSESSSSEDGEGEDEEEEELDEDAKDDADQELGVSVGDDASTAPVCSLCLNLRPSVANEDVVQCDRCGLAVHESCYVFEPVVDDAASNLSSSSTEPWFCEPCLWGLKEPPFCELCPNREGVFKRSDIGGKWVHMICALYCKDITFGDVDRLGAISWQEMDHRVFGKKACAGCADRLEARTGVATECDAALCKNHFHATCAQRLGLLEDHSEMMDDSVDAEHAEPRIIHCKKHSREEVVREKRAAYNRFKIQEERRMISFSRKRLSEREERKRNQQRDRLRVSFEKLKGVTIVWPIDRADMKSRRARHLHTNAHLLSAFADKADMAGVNREEFSRQFHAVRGEHLPFLTPGFSPEFVSYFHHREKTVIPAEQKRLAQMEKEKERLEPLLEEKQEALKYQQNQLAAKKADVEAVRSRLSAMHSILQRLGVTRIAAPNGTAVATGKKKGRPRTGSASSPHHVKKTHVIHSCGECGSSSDQHRLVLCDSCKKHIHLACLDPPLDKMPNKNKYMSFFCSSCVDSSGSDRSKREDASPELGDEDDDVQKPRLRARSDIVKARKMQEAEDDKAFRAATRKAGKVKASRAAGGGGKVKRLRLEVTTSASAEDDFVIIPDEYM